MADTSRPDLVGVVVAPILSAALIELRHCLTRSVGNADAGTARVDVEGVVRSASNGLEADIESLVELPTIEAFHRFRIDLGLPVDRLSMVAASQFCEWGTPSERVVGQYPLLESRLHATISSRIAQIDEIVTAFARDFAALRGIGLIGDDSLRSVDCTHGDPHDGGRHVAVVGAGLRRLVYKPRDFGPDVLLSELVRELDPDGVVDIRLPEFVAGDGYGWQQFVEHEQLPDSAGAARRFHLRAGALLAIFSALGTTDMHVENVLASGEFPIPIDVETLLHPTTEPALGSRARTLAARLCDGPFGTSMLPTGSDSEQRTSIAALSEAGDRTVEDVQRTSIVDAGTDAIRVVSEAAVQPMSRHRPHRAGRSISLHGHVDHVITGYRTATGMLRARAPQLLAVIHRHRHTEFRRVLRPTSVYAAFLRASSHPRYLESADAVESLLALLPPSVAGGEAGLVLEREALRRGDIPRFVARADSVEFREPRYRDAGSSSVQSTVPDTGSDRAARCWSRVVGGSMSEAEAEHALRSSLSVGVRGVDAAPSAPDLRAALGVPVVGTSMARVSRRLAARHVRDHDGTVLGLVQAIPAGVDDGAILVSSDSSLYQGGGAVLVTAAVASRSGAERWHRRLRAEVAPLLAGARAARAAISRDESPRLCTYTGPAGTAWLMHTAATVLGDDDLRREAEGLAHEVLDSVVSESFSSLDVVGGAAGILALHASGRTAHESTLQRGSDGLASALTAVMENGDSAVRGLAHGVDGAAWALCRVDAALERDDHEDVLAAILESGTETSSDPRNAGASWCWGITGIALAHAEIAHRLGDTEQARKIAAQIDGVQIDEDDSICHGEAGLVLTAAHLGALLGDESISESARRRGDRLASRVASRGYRTGHGGSVGVLSLMTGVPGIAYARAVAADSALPNPVALT